jgi:hypothetical protein
MPKLKPQIIDPVTGEIVNAQSTLKDLSRCRKDVLMEIKRLTSVGDAIDEILAPTIEKAFKNGEKKFMDYWDIYSGGSRFNKDLFEKKASKAVQKTYAGMKNTIKEIEANDRFQKEGKPYLKFPKLSGTLG